MGTTQNHRFPWPDESEPVGQGAAAMRVLAEAIDTLLAPAKGSNGSVAWWRFGSIAGCSFTTGGQPNGVTVGTVPSSIRPAADRTFTGYIYASNGVAVPNGTLAFRVRPTGEVFIDNTGNTTPAGGSMRGSAVWMVG